jgi:FkbM family methyltransferase
MSEVQRFYADNMFHGYVEGMDINASAIILDLGTYKGYTTKLLSDLYKCKIYTFEPMLPFYHEAVLACTAHPNILLLPHGLGKGNFDFSMNIAGDSTSMFAKVDPSTAHKCSVRDFFEFINEHNINDIDLLHINIEGGEYDLLDYIFSKDFHKHIRHLIVQFHYPSTENDTKIKGYFAMLEKTHMCNYNYNYVWTKWTRL